MEEFNTEVLEKIRNDLYQLIDEEENLVSAKVVYLSQRLDRALNEYEELKNKKNRIE
ncbi:Spo0E like sporulation regulatory protein [Natranaerovirga pectinivora]|uniref:Spo0E like sporulation regulatory protein n=1 Tax=Natranaerovirga pectinivora TaxID=682400 RepID=A0A4R3MDC0_9FIRM|nr:Spo0E family sporulation regulatory protein-aspartic acid phosphatase [Natranaerovirga pectinivora]TCT11630.1 Spo0E like sporulation regulatory protein [Natranaerovirga pectinivora]